MNYTEEDAEYDSMLLLSEIEDININWMANKDNLKFDMKKHVSPEQAKLYDKILSHLKNEKFLKFASEALDCEIDKHWNIIDTGGSYEAGVAIIEDDDDDWDKLDGKYTYCEEMSRNIPLTVSVKNIRNVERMLSLDESLESKMKQLKKDVERDRILVNGIRLVGAEIGLENTMIAVKEVIEQVIRDCGLPCLNNFVKDELARLVLCKASRTHAGGISFQAIQSFINPRKTIVVPLSAVTPPLKVNIYMGKLKNQATADGAKDICVGTTDNTTTLNYKNASPSSKKKLRWGLVCNVTCESVFQLQNADDPNEIDMDNMRDNYNSANDDGRDRITTVSVLFEDAICFEVNLADKDKLNSMESISGYEQYSGKVHITEYVHA